jgi:hypothetical protein
VRFDDAGCVQGGAGVDGGCGVEEDEGADGGFKWVGFVGVVGVGWCWRRFGGVWGRAADNAALGDDGAGVDYEGAVGGDEAGAGVDEDGGAEGDGVSAEDVSGGVEVSGWVDVSGWFGEGRWSGWYR